MTYMVEMMPVIFIVVTGFATAWICLEMARIVGWREPVELAEPGKPMRKGMDLVLAAFVGPWLLLTNGYKNWRNGGVSAFLYAVLAVIAVGWAMCSGIVVLQIAYSSGYFQI